MQGDPGQLSLISGGLLFPSVYRDSFFNLSPHRLLQKSFWRPLLVETTDLGNRFQFPSFPVPVLDDPTYVGPGGSPRVLGAEGALVTLTARKMSHWRMVLSPKWSWARAVSLLFTSMGWGQLPGHKRAMFTSMAGFVSFLPLIWRLPKQGAL